MYVDNVAIFINPSKNDLEAVKIIMQAFGNSLGLHINLQKSSPIIDVRRFTYGRFSPPSTVSKHLPMSVPRTIASYKDAP